MTAFSALETVSLSRASAPPAPEGEYLSCKLGTEEYGTDSLQAQEIRGFEQPTRLAGVPESICGAINLRGVIVPIVDLRIHVAIGARHDALKVTEVLNMGGRTVGAVIDSVSDVIAFARSQIQPLPAFNSTVNEGHITGIGPVRQGELDRMLTLMDIEQLITKAHVGPTH